MKRPVRRRPNNRRPSSLRTKFTLALLSASTLVGTGLVVAPVAFVA